MRTLIVGSGGREHALALALSGSRSVDALFVAPGNAGTAALAANVPVSADDVEGVLALVERERVDLVVVGPEAPLALGLADAVAAQSARTGRRVLCFGPRAAAARVESSKAFAKDLMLRLGVPTAAYRSFARFDEAAAFASEAPWPLVVKASGLAAGKGVFLPASREEAVGVLYGLMARGGLGDAGREVVLEERLEGEELSVMAFSDGSRIAVMPSARDHKRLRDGDEGPNTGGMGAYAPACPEALAREYAELAIRPVVDELARAGTPFVGVLYAGIMVTPSGPKVLEYNCRLGDPEAEAVLALFSGDLGATLAACASGRLDEALPSWRPGAAAAVVMASPGYPEAPRDGVPLGGLGPSGPAYVLHAGTALAGPGPSGAPPGSSGKGGNVVSKGGRVLCVTARGDDLASALASAYRRLGELSFPGAQYRRDIGARGLRSAAAAEPGRPGADVGRGGGRGAAGGSAYAASGVDIDAGNEAVRLMSAAVRSTYTDAVLAGIGSFGGLYDASAIKAMREPVLVASTDGVGTKVKLAAAAGSYASIGMDIVNHCIDDILVQGARPLFFLDYIASSRLRPAMVAEAVGGMSAACAASGCVLIGGETAEMPGVYEPGEFDVAGSIVGVVERGSILPRPDLEEGDLLVGLRSDSPHTNGYSLVRSAFDGVDLEAPYPGLGTPLKEILLRPHRSYLPVLWPVLSGRPGLVKALAHVTGGGFVENIPRVLPPGLEARVRLGSWPVPPLYGLIERLGRVSGEEMYRVFNMGIGMVAVVAADRADELARALPEACWVIGSLGRAADPAAPARTVLA